MPQRMLRTACIFEREAGNMAWRHFSRPDHIDSRARRDLVLRHIKTIGNYDYLVDWVFQGAQGAERRQVPPALSTS